MGCRRLLTVYSVPDSEARLLTSTVMILHYEPVLGVLPGLLRNSVLRDDLLPPAAQEPSRIISARTLFSKKTILLWPILEDTNARTSSNNRPRFFSTLGFYSIFRLPPISIAGADGRPVQAWCLIQVLALGWPNVGQCSVIVSSDSIFFLTRRFVHEEDTLLDLRERVWHDFTSPLFAYGQTMGNQFAGRVSQGANESRGLNCLYLSHTNTQPIWDLRRLFLIIRGLAGG